MYLYLIICSIQLFFQHFLSILKYSCSSFIAQLGKNAWKRTNQMQQKLPKWMFPQRFNLKVLDDWLVKFLWIHTQRLPIPASIARLSSSLFKNKPSRPLCVLNDCFFSQTYQHLDAHKRCFFSLQILIQSVKLSNSSNFKNDNSLDGLELQMYLGSFIENIFLFHRFSPLLLYTQHCDMLPP